MKETRHFLGVQKSSGVNDGDGLTLTGRAKGFTQICQFYIDTVIFIAELIGVAAGAGALLPG